MDAVQHQKLVNDLLLVVNGAAPMARLALAMDFLNIVVQQAITGDASVPAPPEPAEEMVPAAV